RKKFDRRRSRARWVGVASCSRQRTRRLRRDPGQRARQPQWRDPGKRQNRRLHAKGFTLSHGAPGRRPRFPPHALLHKPAERRRRLSAFSKRRWHSEVRQTRRQKIAKLG